MRSRRRVRRAFTLLELLAIVTVIGILASIAIVKFGATKKRALVATLKSDLRAVALKAETHFIEVGTYEGMVLPSASSGVTVTFEGTASGYVARARHDAIPEVSCTLRQGDEASTEPRCEER